MDIEILSTKEAAELLHSEEHTLVKNARNGFYPKGVCGKHGKFWLFNKQKLLAFVFESDI